MLPPSTDNHLDIYLVVSILNKQWYVRGFRAIQELADWLDQNAESSTTEQPPPITGPAIP